MPPMLVNIFLYCPALRRKSHNWNRILFYQRRTNRNVAVSLSYSPLEEPLLTFLISDGSFTAIDIHPHSQTVDIGEFHNLKLIPNKQKNDMVEIPLSISLGPGLVWDDVYAKLVVRWIQSVTCPWSFGRFLMLIERSFEWVISQGALTSSEVALAVGAFSDLDPKPSHS